MFAINQEGVILCSEVEIMNKRRVVTEENHKYFKKILYYPFNMC